MLIENIKLAFSNFYGSKMRTFLSLLGILIGVTSVILITTLGESGTANIQKEITKEGMDLINVYKGWVEQPLPDMYAPEVGTLAAKQVSGIKKVSPVFSTNAITSSLFKEAGSDIKVVYPAFFEMNRLIAASGDLFPLSEPYFEKDIVVLGNGAARALFPYGRSIGKKVNINFDNGIIRQYEVGAVLKSRGGGMMEDYDNTIYMPYENYSRKVGQIKEVSSWIFQVRSPKESLAVSKNLEQWFRGYGNEQDAFFIMSASSVSNMFKSITKTLKMVLGSIAGISLLVGGIGIMNIMLVSVTERIKEIGIRMALGASPRDIRSQFLIEAVCLTFTGGILGIMAGALIGWGITHFLKWPFTASVPVYMLAMGFSVTVGLFFGLYPAVKASRLDPIQALSRE